MIDKIEFSKMVYGDKVKTESGFMITINEYVAFFENTDGKLIAEYDKPKSYGRFNIREEVIALYKRTCKIKRKK